MTRPFKGQPDTSGIPHQRLNIPHLFHYAIETNSPRFRQRLSATLMTNARLNMRIVNRPAISGVYPTHQTGLPGTSDDIRMHAEGVGDLRIAAPDRIDRCRSKPMRLPEGLPTRNGFLFWPGRASKNAVTQAAVDRPAEANHMNPSTHPEPQSCRVGPRPTSNTGRIRLQSRRSDENESK